MKIKLNNCPKCGAVAKFKDVPIYGMGTYFCGVCTECHLEGERGYTKTLAAEKWNKGDILYIEHEIRHRIIKMCQDEIEKTEIKSKIDDEYVSKLNEMIRYYGR